MKGEVKRVLIVDDDKNFLLSLKDALRKFEDKFTVELAYNGKEALEILKKKKISLIVSDLKMGEMDGLELLNLISQDYPYIPFILMTAYGSPPIKSRAEELGVIQYIEKPITLEELLEAIERGLNTQIPGQEQVRFFSLTSLAQLVSLEGKDCTLIVTEEKGEGRGVLYFRRGNLIHAKTETLEGEEAAKDIFSWENIKVTIKPECKTTRRTIEKKLESLLLEIFKDIDEEKVEQIEEPLFEDITERIKKEKEVKEMPTKYDELIKRFKDIPGYKGVAIFNINGEPLSFHATGDEEKVRNLFQHMASLFVHGEKVHTKADAGGMDFIQTDSDMGKFLARKGEKYIVMTLLEEDGNLALAKEALEEAAKEL